MATQHQTSVGYHRGQWNNVGAGHQHPSAAAAAAATPQAPATFYRYSQVAAAQQQQQQNGPQQMGAYAAYTNSSVCIFLFVHQILTINRTIVELTDNI